MAAAGIGSVRVWLSWAQIEPERGKFNWSMVDASVATNAKAGLTTLPFLFGTPELGGDGSTAGRATPDSVLSIGAAHRCEPAGVRRVRRGGRASLRTGRDVLARPAPAASEPIETWQIWNEPNLSSF